ncbi:MAG: single-stranded DNA-binding protein [Candidatus Omnitrophica bacterium]|nr:single-stranded DNA-binding protein [Candidatus Omnitrophota bacterium]
MNKVIITGNLTRDPELRYTPQGTAIATFTVANNEGSKEKKKVCFVEVTAWDKQAEFINQWFSKGKPILVEGRLQQDVWQDKDSGKNRSKIKITGQRFEFFGGSGEKKQETAEEISLTE